MSMFDSYDEEFVGVCQEISTKLSHVANYSDSHEENLTVLSDIDRTLFDQAKTLIKQMEIETRGEQHPTVKQDMSEKLGTRKKILEGLRKDCTDSKQNEEHAALIDVNIIYSIPFSSGVNTFHFLIFVPGSVYWTER